MATPSRCAPFMVERAFPISGTVHAWPRDRLVIASGSRDWRAHWDARGRCWLKSKRGGVSIDPAVFHDGHIQPMVALTQ